jgi:hypothetical protein
MKIAAHLDTDVMARAAADAAAQILRDALQRQGRAAFVAATGASQFNFLKHLVAARGIAWERTTMFHLDEYIGSRRSIRPASGGTCERLPARCPSGRPGRGTRRHAAELDRLNRPRRRS